MAEEQKMYDQSNSAQASDQPGYFIDRQQYESIKQQIEISSDDPEQLLEYYIEWLKLRDQAHPLLLRNGEAHVLDGSPTELYLLPLIAAHEDNERWIVAQYPFTRDRLPRIEILSWRFYDSDQPAQIESRSIEEIPYEKEDSRKIQHDFVQRALTVDIRSRRNVVDIELQFNNGLVEFNVDLSGKIKTLNWVPEEPEYESSRYERSSFGDMERIICVRESRDANWHTDSLFQLEDKRAVNNPINIPDPITLGKINGVDSPEKQLDYIYFGGDQGRVGRLDYSMLNPNILAQSEVLGGAIYDVLIVPDADESTDQNYAVIASTDNGYVFYIQEAQKKGELDDKLYVRHYQMVGEHLIRLLGFGSRHLVVRDHYNNLIPVYLGNPDDFRTRRNGLTERLYKYFGPPSKDNSKLTHGFWIEPDNCLGKEDSEKRAVQIAELAVEYFIAHSRDQDSVYDFEPFESWCKWLISDFDPRFSEDHWRWLDLHWRLIDRMGNWLKNCCYLQSFGNSPRGLPVNANVLGPLWQLITPGEDKAQIPDEIWLKILREYDWVRRALEVFGKFNNTDFKTKWNEILQQISVVRARLLPAMQRLRPISIVGTTRFRRPVTQIKLLAEDENCYRMAALMPGDDQLIVLSIPKDDPDKPWERVASLNVRRGYWRGRPVALAAGQELEPLLKNHPAQSENTFWCLVATDRGELVALCWNNKKEHFDCYGSDSVNVRTAYIESYYADGYCRLLLGGQNKDQRGVIIQLNLICSGTKIIYRHSQFWLDQDDQDDVAYRSSICKIIISKKYIWALNQRRQSALLQWSVDLLRKLDTSKVQSIDKIWLSSNQPLNCLALDDSDVPSTLLCGGYNGLAYALDVDTGELSWLTSCGKDIHRLKHLRSGNRNSYWLLAGDHLHALILDQDGIFRGAFEFIGPVISLFPISNQRVLAASLYGRLLLLDADPVSREQLSEWMPNISYDEDPIFFESLYPLRSEHVLPTSLLIGLLESIQKKAGDKREYFAVRKWLNEIEKSIKDGYQWNKNDKRTLEAILAIQPAHRVALLLANLRENINKITADTCATVLDICWKQLATRKHNQLVSQLFNHLSMMLEDAVKYHRSNNQLIDLSKKVDRILWKDCDSTENKKTLVNDFEEQSYDELFKRRYRIRGLRLAQVVRIWRSIKANHQEKDVHLILNEFCNELFSFWRCESDLSRLARRLQWVLADDALSLLGVDDEKREWQLWLAHVCAVHCGVNDLENVGGHLDSTPFRILIRKNLVPWTSEELCCLNALWPDDNNWIQWVKRMQDCMRRLGEAERLPERNASDELHRLHQIRVLIEEQAVNWFTTGNNLCLLALFWPLLIKIWGDVIKRYEVNLWSMTKDPDRSFIDIHVKHIEWDTARQAIVELEVHNRHPGSLRIADIYWGDESISDQTTTTQFVEGKNNIMKLKLSTVQDDEINNDLKIILRRQDGYSFELPEKIYSKRSLSKFTNDAGFVETWQRLDELLVHYDRHDKEFFWCDGNYLDDNDRFRLKNKIKDQFGVDVSKWVYTLPKSKACPEYFSNEKSIFSPDIALGKIEGGELIEQIHGLFKQNTDNVNYFALSIWIYFRQDTPNAIFDALKSLLYPKEFVKSLLQNLCGNNYTKFLDALNELPQRSLGAWCCNQPMYAKNATDLENIGMLSADIYGPPIGMLGYSIWKKLQDKNIIDRVIATWFDMEESRVAELNTLFIRLAEIMDAGNVKCDINEMEHLANAICACLGSYTLGALAQSNGVFFGSFKDNPLIILQGKEDYERCYIAITKSLGLQHLIDQVVQAETGYWLCLGLRKPPAGLTNALGLNLQHLLMLLSADRSADSNKQARLILNQIAAAQHSYDPNVTFSVTGGMGSGLNADPVRIERHFEGRKDELEKLKGTLSKADEGGNGSALIVGTRLMGKTSLWQKFVYDLRKEEDNQKPRQIVYLDLHDFSVPEKESDESYERLFWMRFYESAKWGGAKGYALNTDWPIGQKDNVSHREITRQEVKRRLVRYKEQDNKSPVIIIDETTDFARQDWTRGYPLIKYLRTLTTEVGVCLILTSYPFHVSQQWGLNLLSKQGDSSLFNFFGDEFSLSSWPKDLAWSYLQERLGGYGIILPLYYRDQMLQLTRGVPWVVHQLGLDICKILPGQYARRILLRQEWSQAMRNTLRVVGGNLRETINKVADKQGMVARTNRETALLSGGALWDVLERYVFEHESVIFENNEEWSSWLTFDFKEFQSLLPDVPEKYLRAVLNRLTATHILSGAETDQRLDPNYQFTSNQFPAYCYLKDIIDE